jgi:hypothetical protein
MAHRAVRFPLRAEKGLPNPIGVVNLPNRPIKRKEKRSYRVDRNVSLLFYGPKIRVFKTSEKYFPKIYSGKHFWEKTPETPARDFRV